MSLIDAKHAFVEVGPHALLKELTFTIQAGERVAIVGHNGAGKSTLLRALSGFAKVTQGQLNVQATALHQTQKSKTLRQLRAHVAQVHQGLYLVDRASALGNVLIGGAARQTLWGYWSQHEKHQAHACLQRVGMGWASARRTDSLSGGERQKVAIARALHQNAPLILADEPTASLDHDATQEAMQLLVDVVRERQRTLLCVVHDLNLLPHVAQRALVLRQGRLVADVTVDAQTPFTLREFLK